MPKEKELKILHQMKLAVPPFKKTGNKPDTEKLLVSEYSDIKMTANPLIVLREEFDDWALLFNPDTGNTFTLNPLGVFIWKLLDGKQTLATITEAVREAAEDVPAEVESQVEEFVREIVRLGLAAGDGEIAT
ncbi:MAG: SynChlorMet cassette protein ScmD [Syntrophales bacterium]|nr:SynChlorMet cassette protein ScmD [Syntrophales bacterium]